MPRVAETVARGTVAPQAPRRDPAARPPSTPPPHAPKAPWPLVVVGVAVAAVFLFPLGYIVIRTAALGGDFFDSAFSDRVLTPARRSLTVAIASSVSAAGLGTALAWAVMRTDVPLAKLWKVLAPLPLVYPTFVGAAAMQAAVAPGGLIEELLGPFGLERAPDVRGFVGAWLVLTLFTYPYVYLVVAARLSSLPRSLEESARLLGRTPVGVFRSVVFPQIRSAIFAGALLVFLYALSDFGAVAIMGYRTLSVGIFANFQSFNLSEAFARSAVLALMALLVVALERRVQHRSHTTAPAIESRPFTYRLGKARWPAALAVAFVLANALAGPASALGLWAWRGVAGPATVNLDAAEIVDLAWRTAWISVATAFVAVACVLPLAYLTARFRSRAGSVANAIVVSGFALPGVAIALAVVFWALRTSPGAWLYQTTPLLVLAYVVHFGAQTVRASQVAVASVPPDLGAAARMLGAGRLRRYLRVELPLVTPGLAAGGGLVLLSVMKELPVTLILAPTGFKTLATEIWGSHESGFLAETGIAALTLVALSGVLTWFLVIRRAERF